MLIMIVLHYTRKPSIYQTQLDDFLGKTKPTIFHMNVRSEYNAGWKALYPRHARKKAGRPRIHVFNHLETLDYWLGLGLTTKMSPAYLKRCKTAKILSQDEVDPAIAPSWDYIVLHAFPKFAGYVDYLFADDRLVYFDDVEFLLESSGVRVGARPLKTLVELELMRIHVGIEDYTSFQAIFRLFQPSALPGPFSSLGFLPTIQDFSRAFHAVPASCFVTFHRQLIDDLVEFGLINFNIIIWDGQFIRANCSNHINKETGMYTDVDAGFYNHDGKKLGVGYVASTFYAFCGHYLIPLHCEIVPASQNDCVSLAVGFHHFLTLGFPIPKVLIADAGPYSIENLQLIWSKNVVPLINSRKNITKQNVQKLGEHLYINKDFVPSSWTDDEIKLLFALRTSIERAFSHNIQVYKARRMNVIGTEAMTKARYLILILDALKAKTAYKIGRPDLIGKARSFDVNRKTTLGVMPSVAQDAGYEILVPNMNKQN
jgi:hypothetical protein